MGFSQQRSEVGAYIVENGQADDIDRRIARPGGGCLPSVEAIKGGSSRS
jgi:hypothetical protein